MVQDKRTAGGSRAERREAGEGKLRMRKSGGKKMKLLDDEEDGRRR